MTVEFFWREHIAVGGRRVAGPFDTAREAGVWRREHPPVINGAGPTLIKLVDGNQVDLGPGDYADCFSEFAATEEPRIDLSAEAVRFP